MSHKPLETRFLITVQRPGLWLASALALLVLVLTGFWVSFDYGRSVAGYDADGSRQLVAELEQQLQQANEKIAATAHRAAMLERNNKIDSDASRQLKVSLDEAQAEVMKLKKELAFYKSIVSPEQTKRSLAIQTIQLEGDGEGGYKYRIMVSQKGRNDRFVRGVLQVGIKGSRDGVETVMPLKNVSKQAKKSLKFGFKYFQNFEGTLKLPADFVPESMRVQVKPNSRKIDTVDETFAWTDLTAGGKQNVGQKN